MRAAVLIALLLAGLVPAAGAAPWSFGDPVMVTDSHGPKVFHHLESAGQRSIAVAGGTVAVVWEDNRSGSPRAYAAFKAVGGGAFGHEVRLSGDGAAYAPAVAALGARDFLVAWEGADGIRARRLRPGADPVLGPVAAVAAGGRTPTVAAGDGRAFVAWAARGGGHYPHIAVAAVTPAKGGGLAPGEPAPVEAEPPQAAELSPALA
ncbi:MAG TPA: hypothetical protein VKA55_04085, partial [Gammaproteobacteria bacterium]|nr:hypothetical protein [Gammaproteobacteria bacterium]